MTTRAKGTAARRGHLAEQSCQLRTAALDQSLSGAATSLGEHHPVVASDHIALPDQPINVRSE
jgi:hypothetical protein